MATPLCATSRTLALVIQPVWSSWRTRSLLCQMSKDYDDFVFRSQKDYAYAAWWTLGNNTRRDARHSGTDSQFCLGFLLGVNSGRSGKRCAYTIWTLIPFDELSTLPYLSGESLVSWNRCLGSREKKCSTGQPDYVNNRLVCAVSRLVRRGAGNPRGINHTALLHESWTSLETGLIWRSNALGSRLLL